MIQAWQLFNQVHFFKIYPALLNSPSVAILVLLLHHSLLPPLLSTFFLLLRSSFSLLSYLSISSIFVLVCICVVSVSVFYVCNLFVVYVICLRVDGRILSSSLASQYGVHAEFGGVVPLLAYREHEKNIRPVFEEALAKYASRT